MKNLVEKSVMYCLVATVIFSFGYFFIQALTFAIGMIVPVAIIAFLCWVVFTLYLRK